MQVRACISRRVRPWSRSTTTGQGKKMTDDRRAHASHKESSPLDLGQTDQNRDRPAGRPGAGGEEEEINSRRRNLGLNGAAANCHMHARHMRGHMVVVVLLHLSAFPALDHRISCSQCPVSPRCTKHADQNTIRTILLPRNAI